MIRRTPKSPLTATRFPYPTLCRSAIFGGVTCEGKAALVLRGDGARVEGVVFQNMRVPDGNGAGIRLERSDLDVVNAMFRGSEQGILTRSEEHTSELQSPMRISYAVFCLKKKQTNTCRHTA